VVGQWRSTINFTVGSLTPENGQTYLEVEGPTSAHLVVSLQGTLSTPTAETCTKTLPAVTAWESIPYALERPPDNTEQAQKQQNIPMSKGSNGNSLSLLPNSDQHLGMPFRRDVLKEH